MSKDKERFKAILTEAAELYFTAEAQQNTVSAGDFTDEVEILANFQIAANEFLQDTQDRIDNSWNELSKDGTVNLEKFRIHETFVASVNRFKIAVEKLEDVENYLRDNDDDEHS